MRFNARHALSLLTSLFVPLCLFSACGQLGDKKPAATTMLPGSNIGCFDQIGTRTTRFFNGQIEAPEWEDTFNCVHDQITFFKKYVRGASPDGYNQTDIASLVRQLLITNRPVSDAFIASIFDLKASVFGGKPDLIAPEEIDEFIKLNEVLRKESMSLLPILQARKRNPSTSNMLALADGLNAFGTALGNYLDALHGTIDVDKSSFLPFARELIDMSGGDRTLVDRYGDIVRNVKVVVASGSADKIEKGSWATLIREGASFGGLLLAYSDMEDYSPEKTAERDQFTLDLLYRLQTVMNRVISHHDSSGIPLELFDPVIDTLPTDFFDDAKRTAVKHDMRQIVYHALQGGVKGWLTPAAIQTLVSIAEGGLRSQVHLKKIYLHLPVDPQVKEFETAARDYLATLTTAREQAEVNRIIAISKDFIGLFPEDSAEMMATATMRQTRTRNHMMRMAWYKTLIDHLFSVYATGPETAPGEHSAKVTDLEGLIGDFQQVLLQWKLSNPTLSVQEMAKKRFREGNLFMPISNGDTYFTNAETTYYMAFLFSSSSFSGRVYREVTHSRAEWSACPIIGKDELDQDAVEADCFRKVYFGNPQIFWSNFPNLQIAYAKLDATGKAQMAHSMEIAARTWGIGDKPIGPYDIDSFAALPHYVEDMMERFDENSDQVLDKHEVLDLAYPILKTTLSESANTTSDTILKGVLTYIIHYGEAPSSTIKLLAWIAKMPFTKIEADRNSVYNIVALLSAPPTPKKGDPVPSTFADPADIFPTTNQ